MPLSTPREARYACARVRWVFSLFFLCGLRISEMVGNVLDGQLLLPRRSRRGGALGGFEVTGKGDKTRLVPTTSELMVEATRYRRSLGLPALPQVQHEATPLVLHPSHGMRRQETPPATKPPRALTRAAVHGLVKDLFERAAQHLASTSDDCSPARAWSACEPRPRTGCGTRRPRGWPTGMPTCAMSETPSVTPPPWHHQHLPARRGR